MTAARSATADTSVEAGKKGEPADEGAATGDGDGLSASPSITFQVGDLVALRSDPEVVVPIIEVAPGGAETRYQVFQDNRKATYYGSQLRSLDHAEKPSRLTAGELRAYLTSLHLLSPSATNLYSLRSGRVQFVPYQYRPVLRLNRADRPRLLIADEVGVGKTIEAGLIIKELRARMDISSVLIICPKALVSERKWFVEMKRFDEHFTALDGHAPARPITFRTKGATSPVIGTANSVPLPTDCRPDRPRHPRGGRSQGDIDGHGPRASVRIRAGRCIIRGPWLHPPPSAEPGAGLRSEAGVQRGVPGHLHGGDRARDDWGMAARRGWGTDAGEVPPAARQR